MDGTKKSEDDLRNEDDIKIEDDLKNEEDLKIGPPLPQFFQVCLNSQGKIKNCIFL